jgi:hypothetical protein
MNKLPDTDAQTLTTHLFNTALLPLTQPTSSTSSADVQAGAAVGGVLLRVCVCVCVCVCVYVCVCLWLYSGGIGQCIYVSLITFSVNSFPSCPHVCLRVGGVFVCVLCVCVCLCVCDRRDSRASSASLNLFLSLSVSLPPSLPPSPPLSLPPSLALPFPPFPPLSPPAAAAAALLARGHKCAVELVDLFFAQLGKEDRSRV